MEPLALLVLAVPIAVIAGVAITVGRSRDRKRAAWGAAALRLGLVAEESATSLRGWIDGFTVSVTRGESGRETLVEVDGRGRIDRRLRVAPRRSGGAAALPPVGDPAFDRAVALEGEGMAVIAALAPETRDRLASAASIHGARVEDGRIFLRAPWVFEDPAELARLVTTAAALAALLGAEGASRDRLVRAALRDTAPGVRAAVIRLLAEAGGEVPIEALVDDDAAVRASARSAAGEGAAARLRACVESDGRPAALRARALSVLVADGLAAAEARRAIDAAISSGDTALCREAIVATGALGGPDAREILSRLARDPSAEVAAAVADAYGASGDRESESPLLAILARWEPLVKRAAARALGRVGGAAAVEPLLALSRGLLADPEVKRAARAALEEIRSRLDPEGAGRLALSEPPPEAGRLTIPAKEGGELSRAECEGEEDGKDGDVREDPRRNARDGAAD